MGANPVVLDIDNAQNLRAPSGNEAGAWKDLWVPGGYTSGGIPEAVIDQIEAGSYSVSNVY